MEVQLTAPCGRRCTIGSVHEMTNAAASAMHEYGVTRPQINTLSPLPNQESGQDTEGDPADNDLSGYAYSAPDEELGSGASMREAQQLFLWSANPTVLRVPSAADSSGGIEGTPRAASPSDALMHSLGDADLRSAMRPPAFLPQQDWLRHLILQSIEDAQLLFSSLWEDCTCSTVGLPRTSCSENQLSGVLDPVIAFCAGASSAPKRRLGRGGNEEPPNTDESKDDSSYGIVPNGPKEWPSTHRIEIGHNSEINERGSGKPDSDPNVQAVQLPPTAREYISAAMSWATRQLHDPNLFPSSRTAVPSGEGNSEAQNNPDEALMSVASLMVRRLLRCYAHVYLWHLPLLQQHGAVGHANRCLKHLLFLAADAQLLDRNEGALEPIRSLADAWLHYDQTHASQGTPPKGQMAPAAAAPQLVGDELPDDWFVPALEKAEGCLGVLDREEYPLFGAREG